MILNLPTLARPADVDVSDLTTAKRTGRPRWVGPARLSIPFDKEPTPAEVAAIRRRLTTKDATEEELVRAAEKALADLESMLTPPATQPPPRVIAEALVVVLRWRLKDRVGGTLNGPTVE